MPLEEEPDLDYGDELTDPNADSKLLDAPRYERSERAPYASDPEQMRGMWELARASRKGKRDIVEPGGDVEDFLWDTRPLPPKPKALAARLRAAGWDVRTLATSVIVADLLYVGRSEDHDPGDVRTPTHAEHRWSVQALLATGGKAVAWCWATWEYRETGAKPGNKFVSALVWDLVNQRGYEPTATGFEEWVSIFAPKP